MEWIKKILTEEFEKQERIYGSSTNEKIVENSKQKMNDCEILLNTIKNLEQFKKRTISETIKNYENE